MSTTTYGSVVIDSPLHHSLDSDQVLAPQTQRVFHILRSIVTIAFLVSLLAVALYVVMTTKGKSALEDLQDLAVLFRHGERQPMIPIPSLGYNQPGDLTTVGAEQMSRLGERTKRQYRQFVTDVKSARVVAADESRSRMSAELFMKAIGIPFEAEYIPYMAVKPNDPHFEEQEKIFRTHVSDCMKQVATKVIQQLQKSNESLVLPESFQLLYGILIADSLDMLREKGIDLPFDLDKLKCVREEKIFLTPRLYKALTNLAMTTFAKPTMLKFAQEIRALRANSKTASLLSVSLSDVHISGLLSIINPDKPDPGRPGFGAHLLFHFFQNDVEVLYASSVDSVAEVWSSRELVENFLERIDRATL